ncbi:aminoglycoside adenylyltransferase [Rhizobium sp. Leaf384]|uniref:GNAT family N-acetyltransferase n=1 Tax=unclassified Rhizobium TaxID=2613769 RepID=UPI000712E55B|nr:MULTISPECIES: GNAT family N-acetyltransferase [unclassified Rhizobium]KQS76064.1 aminoglycoside adenylyltransferase [Rhizobium sp. Leaf384]KQS85809.1 aminoglycoside adenylyltransferase [Rhizobium sp. Leaf383]
MLSDCWLSTPSEPDERYGFRRLHRADFPRLAQWFAEPHVRAWWGAAEVELEAIARAMETGEIQPMIVEWEGRPIAYLQAYDPHRERDHPYRDQPVATVGIDMAIGAPEDVGRGHGGGIALQFAARLFATGALRIIVDPHPENSRAIRAYEKSGFRFIDQRHSHYGPAYLMALDHQIEEMDTP